MRLSGLALAAVLLSAAVAFAQHGGGGGGGGSSGGGSSGGGSSGGGSHGGGGGGSSSSGGSGGHSSGGGGGGHSSSSGGHSSGSPGSGAHGSKGSSVTRTGGASSIREPNGTLQSKSAPEKRTFFSFLRHPFRKPEPKAAMAPRPPVCLKGPCRICPPGQAGRGCIAGPPAYVHHVHDECRYPLFWTGSSCLAFTPAYDLCGALLRESQRQGERMQAAQTAEQNACSQGQSQTCSEATASRQNEESLYQRALDRYRRCRMGGSVSHHFTGSGLPDIGGGLSYDPFRLESRY